MKVNLAKSLASKLSKMEWEKIYLDSYSIKAGGYNFYKRKLSKNYWQFTVSDDITSCTFKMYQKER